MPVVNEADEREDLYEVAVDEAIAACGGDLRAALKALLIANEFLEHQLESISVQVSNGYSRGRIRGRSSGA